MIVHSQVLTISQANMVRFQLSLLLTSLLYLTASHSLPLNISYNFGNSPTGRSSSSGVMFPALVFACVLVIIIWSYIHERFCQGAAERTDAPQVLRIMIVCEIGQFEYMLVIRVGRPTANFNMQHGYIEVTVLGPGDVVLGHPVRFKCSKLPNRVCSEMHLWISSLKELSHIEGLKLNHGDSKGSIFLYETIFIDTTNNSVVEVHRFNTYLTNKPTVYRGIKVNFNEPNPFDGLYLLELPNLEWTPIEFGMISSFFIMVIFGKVWYKVKLKLCLHFFVFQ